MRVRATLTLDLSVKTFSEAAKLLEPLLALDMPGEQVSLTVKGQDWYEPKAERNGKRVSRTRAVRDDSY